MSNATPGAGLTAMGWREGWVRRNERNNKPWSGGGALRDWVHSTCTWMQCAASLCTCTGDCTLPHECRVASVCTLRRIVLFRSYITRQREAPATSHTETCRPASGGAAAGHWGNASRLHVHHWCPRIAGASLVAVQLSSHERAWGRRRGYGLRSHLWRQGCLGTCVRLPWTRMIIK